MLNALLRKQLMEMGAFFYQSGKGGRRRSRAAMVGYAALMLYVLVAMGAMVGLLARALCGPLVEAGLGWLYFALLGTMALVMETLFCAFMSHSTLYQARDNEALLAMPIPPWKLLLVRMLSLYAMAVLIELVLLLPAAWVYGQTVGLGTWTGALAAVGLLLPLLALSVACLLGWLMAHVSGRIPGKNLLLVLLALAFIVGYYYLVTQIYAYLQLLLVNSQELGRWVKLFLYPMYLLGQAAQGAWLPLLGFAGVCLLPFALVYGLLSHSFLRLATSRRSAPPAAFREKSLSAAGVDAALLRREFLRLGGSTTYMLNCGLGTVLLLAGTGMLLFRGEWLLSLLESFPLVEGMLPLLACGMVCLLADMNDLTAPSISLEGKNLWIVQSLPLSAWRVLRAKLLLHVCMTLPLALLACLCAAWRLETELWMGALMLLFTGAFVLLGGAAGLLCNLKLPSLDWTNETVPVKQSASVMLTLLGGWVLLLALGGIYWLLRAWVAPGVFLLLSTAVLAAADAALLLWLRGRGAAILESL